MYGEATNHVTFRCKLWGSKHNLSHGFYVRHIIYNVMVKQLSWAPCAQGAETSFSEAHQIMNRHRPGVQFGLLTESLNSWEYYAKHLDLEEGETEASSIPDNELELTQLGAWSDYVTQLPQNSRRMLDGEFPHRPASLPTNLRMFSHESRCKILNDELFIRRHYRIIGPPVSSWDIIKLLTDLELPV